MAANVRTLSKGLFFWTCTLFALFSQADEPAQLSKQLEPWISVVTGKQRSFTVTGHIAPAVNGKAENVQLRLVRFDDESFDLELEHADYAVHIRRRANGVAFGLPKHQVVYLGEGDIEDSDHLKPAGMLERLVGSGTALQIPVQMIANAQASDVVSALTLLTKLEFSAEHQAWQFDQTQIRFSPDGSEISCKRDDSSVNLKLSFTSQERAAVEHWPSMRIERKPREEIEKQLARGVRRALEVLAPSPMLTSPRALAKQTPHGELMWIEGQRIALLHGSAQQIGNAHGELLKDEAVRCIDSVLYAFGSVQTVVTGRWFRDDLESAYERLSPHIPERHKVETRALAASLGMEPRLVEVLNVFPELFHCSGFAVFGNATADGKLYHGRVLDYMTTIGLQDAATTFIVAPDGMIPFANVGYAGFIGSVSGMNAEKISLGEMGGRGEGQWDGVPMATLMRRALEECSSLDMVKSLWQNSPRTCEYYYVFADGEERSAVGVAATPQSIQFVLPGEAHPLLGEGIEDSVVLSAGSRLEELRRRVQSGHGKIDVQAAMALMSRPVAMASNLHNVLFVPEDGVLYVANANHKQPAAERPYVKLDLQSLLSRMPTAKRSKTPAPLSNQSQFDAKDSLDVGHDDNADAQECLSGLIWTPEAFSVDLEESSDNHGDWLVRFPSSRLSGNGLNDRVAMEWYQAKGKSGKAIDAPAAVVVHESGSGMTVGRMIARSLQLRGIHAFMLHLPYYGARRGPEGRPAGTALLAALQQSIADARRAKDAVAALPFVESDRISLQGTSLGGFVTATTAGLDQAYHRVIVLLAGGDLYGVLINGKKDAAKVRDALIKADMSEEESRRMLATIEPLRLAHRMDRNRTWIFSGLYDDVVPPRNSKLLADAVGLAPSHHVQMPANHYSGIIFLPIITNQIATIMQEPAQQ
jgi:dienelactone hydrolase